MSTDYDISDVVWEKIKPRLDEKLIPRRSSVTVNRNFINGILWMLKTGARWQDIPLQYGNTQNILRRFYRWRDKGIWVYILEVLISEPGFEWLTNDEVCVKTYIGMPFTTKDNQSIRAHGGVCAGNIWPWMRLFKETDVFSGRLPQFVAQYMNQQGRKTEVISA